VDAIGQNHTSDRTVDTAHLLHALGGEPDLVSDGDGAARLHLQPDIFALRRIGVRHGGNAESGGERPEFGAAGVFGHQHFGGLGQARFHRLLHSSVVIAAYVARND
jgi:hypothetical protein